MREPRCSAPFGSVIPRASSRAQQLLSPTSKKPRAYCSPAYKAALKEAKSI